MCTVKKHYVNQSSPNNSKMKIDIAKISAVYKPLKNSMWYNFGNNRSKFIFWGVKGFKENH